MDASQDNSCLFALRVTDQRTATRLLNHWPTHTVSLLDPDFDQTFPIPTGQWCRCFFHDITPEKTRCFSAEPVLAEVADVERILAFTATLNSTDRLLIHCHAGISRSTAVACGVLCQYGLSPAAALDRVIQQRPMAYPNAHLLQLFDAALGLGSVLADLGNGALHRCNSNNLYQE